MPTIRELFREEVKGLTRGLYEKSKIYIESQGAINPPRLKALALSSPNSIADLVGITAAAALGIPIGHANRPSDTIFNSNKFFDKPLIGLAGPLAQRNTGIINPTKAYYIKQTPAPYQVVNQIKNGISSNPLGTLLTAAKNELRDGTIREIFAKRSDVKDKYGSKNQHVASRSKPLNEDVKFSEKFPVYSEAPEGLLKLLPQIIKRKVAKDIKQYTQQTGLANRTVEGGSKMDGKLSKWDSVNTDLLNGTYADITKLQDANKLVNVPYVAFEVYGKSGADAHILLPGTISGISEDIAPAWNNYKYIGSPFNTYRYSGVERSIKFDLQLYANGKESLQNLKKNLDKLRELTFPDKEVVQIEYAKGNKITNGFAPMLTYLTISGYYKKLFGFIDSLGISIEDGTPWPTTDEGFDGVKETPYPAVVNVSVSMKIIEAVDEGKGVLVFNMTDTTKSTAFNAPEAPAAPKSLSDLFGLKGLPSFNANKLLSSVSGKLGGAAPKLGSVGGKIGGKLTSPLKIGKIP